MTPALEKLLYYFEYLGTASVAAWMCAAVLVLLYAVFWRRSTVCWTALAAAVAAVVLAEINSDNVKEIKIDFSEELRAAAEADRNRTADAAPQLESNLSDAARQAQRAEVEDQEPDDGDPAAAPGPEPLYRQSGKAQRIEGKQVEDKIPIDLDASEETAEAHVRTMKMHEVAHARRLDRLNRLLAALTLCATLALVVIDYFRRFNSTFGCYLPLPFSGRLVDSLFPKSYTVRGAGGRRDWKAFLRQTVRKGETFILFSHKDPWPDRYLFRLPSCLPFPWRLEKVTCGNGENRFDHEFLFESAWFGRYCFVVVGDGPQNVEWLDSMADFLELRRATRASARHTVNVLWDLETDVATGSLDRLYPLCRETNFRLITTR